MRAASDLTRRPTCTLDEELKLLEGYAAIMCERFGDRVVLHWQIDEAARSCRVPTLAVQPLLENAFRHGVERFSERTELWDSARCTGERLRVEVARSRGELAAGGKPGVGCHHGTPCAGVAAAVGQNSQGVVGIAYKCKILPVKILLADNPAPVNVLADAIRYAGQRADVLSGSWGIPPSSNMEQAIKEVVQLGRGGKGCPVFFATGNEYQSSIRFPASIPEAIAIGASTNQGLRANYSNYGEGIDLVVSQQRRNKKDLYYRRLNPRQGA